MNADLKEKIRVIGRFSVVMMSIIKKILIPRGERFRYFLISIIHEVLLGILGFIGLIGPSWTILGAILIYPIFVIISYLHYILSERESWELSHVVHLNIDRSETYLKRVLIVKNCSKNDRRYKCDDFKISDIKFHLSDTKNVTIKIQPYSTRFKIVNNSIQFETLMIPAKSMLNIGITINFTSEIWNWDRKTDYYILHNLFEKTKSAQINLLFPKEKRPVDDKFDLKFKSVGSSKENLPKLEILPLDKGLTPGNNTYYYVFLLNEEFFKKIESLKFQWNW